MTGVRLSTDIVQALTTAAKDEGKTRSDLIREWIVENLRERGYLPKGAA